jgi:dipeptidyl aminopeptidase/acylaminoacyl peptidase
VRKVARKYNASYHEFPDHAHWLLGEPGWEDVAEYIASWLERAVGPSGD